MTAFDLEGIKTHLADKWHGKCPMCEANIWHISEKLFQLTEFFEGATVVGGSVVPVLPIACQNCGFTVLVSPLVAARATASPSPSEGSAVNAAKDGQGGEG